MEITALICAESWNPVFLVFTDQAPKLLYYSHIPTAIAALIIGLFVFFKSGKSLESKLLLSLAVVFSLRSFVNLIAWTNADSGLIMFTWSLLSFFYVAMYVLSLYFTYVFLDKKDVSGSKKVVFFFILLPTLLLYPTAYNLTGFDAINCEAIENKWFIGYYYLLGLLIFLWILVLAKNRYRNAGDSDSKKQIMFFTTGMGLFLFSFFLSSYLASLVDNFEWEQYGFFGMAIFMGLLAYLIVKYKAFDVRLLGAQALVITLVLLVGSQLFFIKTTINIILTGATLLITSVAGYFLIRSVKNEVKRKEELQEIATKLAVANEELKKLDNAKSEFISIASHQLRTPLTAIKGFLSLVLEGSYGKLSAEVEDVLNKVYVANSHLVDLVENLLNISRIESGRIQYQFALTDISSIVHELEDAFSIVAKGRNLEISFVYPDKPIPPFLLDMQKIREVISNMIDNAIKYTQKGGVTVRLSGDETKARVSVTDTGVGIAPEDLAVLFQKFRRGKESGKVNVSGTGLGLYVAKNFTEAHGGSISIESEGVGKGSTFTLELPLRTEAEPKNH